MESENKRLHEWFGKCIGNFVWSAVLRVPTPQYINEPCLKCGKKWAVHLTPPAYNEESGFFALLSGLTSRGYEVNFYYEAPNFDTEKKGRWQVRLFTTPLGHYVDEYADTLPEALFQATIKVMTSEEKAG